MTSSRAIGLLCTVAALLGAVSGLVLAFMDPSVADDRWSYPQSAGAFAATQSWFVVQHIPLLLGLVAAVPAIGASRVGRWGWFVGCAGMVILTLTEALAILPRDEAADSSLVGTIEAIYGAGTLLIALGLMVGGAAAIRARVWSRFEAWVLFALGAWLIFPTLPMLSLSFMGARLSITGWMLLFAVLGWVLVRRSSSVAVRRPRARLV